MAVSAPTTDRTRTATSRDTRTDVMPPARRERARSTAAASAVLLQIRQAGSRVPTWSSRLVFALGLVSIAAAVFPQRRVVLDWPLDLLPPLGLATVSILGIAVGFGLLIMARGLRQRKQRAWRTVVVLLAVGIVVHLVRGVDPVQTAISLAVTTVLILNRRQFIGQGDPRSRRSVPVVFASMTLACWVVGCLYTQADRDELVIGWTWPEIFLHSAAGMVGVSGPIQFVTERAATQNSLVLLGLGVITVLVTVMALLRSSAHLVAASAGERQRLRDLLARHGERDSLGYFATRSDKSVIFSPSGKAAVAYRVVSGVCLAAGDPIGDVEAWPGAIEAWLRLTYERAWIPAVLATSETGARVYRRVGLDALEIGDEAILIVSEFTLEGRAMRSVRQAVTRARRAGHTTTISRVRDLSATDRKELETTSASWRVSRVPDRGFSMALSRFASPEDPEAIIVQARTHSGRLLAVLQLVPWGRRGWSLDLMRRDPNLDNGVMEMMISDLVEVARAQGITKISLNFAMFRSSLARGERIGAGPFLRAWVGLLLFASRWWQIASLYRANAKLRPSWEPRFLCFASMRDLGPITFAALQAEGFITIPRLQPRLSKSRADTHRLGPADPLGSPD